MPVSQVPAANPSTGLTVGSALDSLQRFVAERRQSGPVADFEAFELKLRETMREVEREILAGELAKLDVDVPAVEIEGESARQVIRREQVYFTAAGKVRVMRSRYRSRSSSRTECPLELRAGIVAGTWTPLAAKQACWAMAHLTSKDGADLFRLMGGMSPSASSLDRLPKRVGERWEADREDFEQLVREDEHVPDEAVAMAVSLDGVMVPMNDEADQEPRQDDRRGRRGQRPGTYREASCASISFYDSEGERLRTIRLARMPEPKKRALKASIGEEVGRALAERPELRVVKIADGALDNWEYLGTEIPVGVEVIDFYHATEHLRAFLECAYGEGSAMARQQYEKLRLKLRDDHGGVEKVIRSLRHLCAQHPRKKMLETERTYFQRNKHRMNYAALLEMNLPIGSGVVEATCKSVVTQRLKRSGMRWGQDGGQAILTLRSLIQSDRFEPAWDVLVSTYKRDVRVPDGVLEFPAARSRGVTA
jgi:hypothetical protein